MKALLLTLALSLSVACSTPRTPSEQLSNHTIRYESYWAAMSLGNLPLEERIFPAPPELLDFLTKDNHLNGFVGIPTKADLSGQQRKEIKQALRELPLILRKRAAGKLLGMFFVKNLGSSGFTEAVVSKAGVFERGIMVFDVSVLSRKANDWASYRENSPFRPDGHTTIRVRIRDKKEDTRAAAFQYLFLHELGHLLAHDLHEDKWIPDDFSALSRKKDCTHLLGGVRFYAPQQEQVDISRADAIWSALEGSDFLTLYAALKPTEDFAESFAAYIHGVILQKPYELTVSREGKVLRQFHFCWKKPQCEAKKQWMAEFLE